MNLMNKLMEKRKTDNKGFSLVELIIVIAIMAILVGIVGTQVLPYLERSKESKDLQLVNSYSTAAMTSYTSNVSSLSAKATTLTVNVYNPATGDATLLSDKIQELTYNTIGELTGKMASQKGKTIQAISVTYDFTNKKITTQAYSDKDCTAGKEVLDAVIADL